MPLDYAHLREFANGGAKTLASHSQEWATFAEELTAAVEAEVQAHLKACSKCRAFSVFSRTAGLQRQPPLTELTLATLCKDCMHGLNHLVASDTLREKDRIIAEIAEAMAIGSESLAGNERVSVLRLDASFSSLAACAAERKRVLNQASMREELRPVLTRLSDVRGALSVWRSVAAPHFQGRKIPHEFMSVVTGNEVEEAAERLLQGLTANAATLAADWERKWHPVDFREVFSLFGEPLFDFERMMLERPPGSGDSTATDWQGLLDAEPLPQAEVEKLRPMRVAVRVRPMLSHEAGDEASARILDDASTVSFRVPSGGGATQQSLSFDEALQGSQAELFSRSGVKALVHKACEGYAATVFAYGQTGAGKTHSLFGPRDHLAATAEDLVACEESRMPACCYELIAEARRAKVCGQGLLPRAVQFLFTVLQASRRTPCTVRASFMEIYNEKVFDLLNPAAAPLEVHQKPQPQQGFQVSGLTRMECQHPQALLQVMRQGVAARHTCGHSGSRDSSRAHAIFTVELPAQSSGRAGGRLVFADLAGSERLKRIQGASQHETAHINKSLLMLSNCISALASPTADTNSAASAFRNSKLTKVLMDSLCGTGYTLVLAAISPAQRHFDETANTLFFAAKCANVTRRAEPKLTAQQREVRCLQDTVDALRAQLDEANRWRCASPRGTSTAELEKLRRELEEERQKSAALQRELTEVRTGSVPFRRSLGSSPGIDDFASRARCSTERGRRTVRSRSETRV